MHIYPLMRDWQENDLKKDETNKQNEKKEGVTK